MDLSLIRLTLLLLLSANISSAEVLSFEIPVTNFHLQIMNSDYGSWIWIPGEPCQGHTGFPALPAVPVKLALPYPGEIISVEITKASYSDWGVLPHIIPVTDQVPASRPWEFQNADPDPLIYEQDAFFPSEPILQLTSGVLWGIPVASTVIHPIRWNPVTGELERLNELQIQVIMERQPAGSITRRTCSSENRAIDMVRNLVVNPYEVSGSGAALVEERDLEYGQYIIICTPELQDEFQVLADWKTAKGIPASVYTTQWIEQNYSFSDIQSEIRAFLTDCRDKGADFVLLAGDDDLLPARKVYLCSKIRPSDLYFADINDSYPGEDLWDSNRNGFWAEPGDNIDWHPDLWVGRASVSTEEQAEIFVSKVLFYEHVEQTWSTGDVPDVPVETTIGYSTGMMSENPLVWGSEGAEIISAMIPSGWTEEKRYESQGNNSTELTIEMINMGMHHIYHCSHGAEMLMWTAHGDGFWVSDIMALENISAGGSVSIWNSIACLIGAFDTDTCCADAWIASPNGGGFGCFNTDNGYYSSSSPGSGASDLLIQRFFTEYIQNDVYELGIAHGLCLDHFCPPSWNTYTEYVVKSYNLFGDPELPMWSTEGSTLSVTHPSAIDGNSTVQVIVTSSGTPVHGARVCCQKGNWQSGEIYQVATTDPSGIAQLYLCPETTGQISVTVWSRNHNSYLGEIEVNGTGMESEQAIFGFGIQSISPNPASRSVSFRYCIDQTGEAALSLYDLTGRLRETILSGYFSPGEHHCSWNSSSLESGLYFVRLSSETSSSTVPLVVTAN